MRDTTITVADHCALVKYSPEQNNLLRKIYENIESQDLEPIKKLKKLSMTRWTIRSECLKRIIDNYESLLGLWEICLEENLDQ